MRRLIHFAHGNGFPSPCYRQLLQCLGQRFDYCYIERVGHDPQYPVTENWHFLVNEVIDSIQSQASEPVIAVGHSLGGVLSLLAALERPELFSAVVLLDSPLIGRIKSRVVRISKALGMIDRLTPAFRTRKRQQHWHTRDQAFSYLKSRALFKTFTDACLEDYITYGMEKDENGYSLRFNSQIEYQIYRTIPHILHQHEGQLKVPAALIYGDKSNVIDRWDIRYMQKRYGILNFEISGSHMFPMECPKMAADLIIDVVSGLIYP